MIILGSGIKRINYLRRRKLYGAEYTDKKIMNRASSITGGIGRKGICNKTDNFYLGNRKELS